MHYYQFSENIFGLTVQLFSVLGGLFMAAKLVDHFVSCCFGGGRKRRDGKGYYGDRDDEEGVELGGV